jgi:hypothetical protein
VKEALYRTDASDKRLAIGQALSVTLELAFLDSFTVAILVDEFDKVSIPQDTLTNGVFLRVKISDGAFARGVLGHSDLFDIYYLGNHQVTAVIFENGFDPALPIPGTGIVNPL